MLKNDAPIIQELLLKELTRQRLCESAALYADIYEADDDTREWMDAALSEWPE